MQEIICPDDRWAWAEIDKNALRHNVYAIKAKLKPGVALMCVVKADAYGHGASECGKIMKTAGADMFGVATVDEGIALRCSLPNVPILILSEPPITSIDKLLEFDLMPSIYSPEFALALGEAAASAGKVAKYHMAIDTGMSRIGVDFRDVVDLRDQLSFHRGIECDGTFTHFATADVVGDWDWELQRKHFDQAIDALRDAGHDPGIVHCANTATIALHEDAQYDMVRAGIGLYGLDASPATKDTMKLQSVMSVRARVTHAFFPQVGTGVSYGMNYRVSKPNIQIATIPIGYADGYSRSLSGRVNVLSGGCSHKQVGNICMDQCMFAVEVNKVRSFAPASPVEVGDVVTVMGTDGDLSITADDLADLLGTINYEVITSFGIRLDRIYI